MINQQPILKAYIRKLTQHMYLPTQQLTVYQKEENNLQNKQVLHLFQTEVKLLHTQQP